MRYRFDRLVTLAVANPLQNLLKPFQQNDSVPILMYHSISSHPLTSNEHSYYCTTTSQQQFQRQISSISSLGYTFGTLTDAVAAVAQNRIEQKKVVITFDDGYEDFYTNALPVLMENKASATMFVPTAFISDTSNTMVAGKQYLNWRQIRHMHTLGIAIGSHTVSHPKLSSIPRDQVKREIIDSKKTIEDTLGQNISLFSYPFQYPEPLKDFTSFLSELLAEAGYTCCVTTILGRVKAADNLFSLKRLPVNEYDDMRLLAAKLSGAYDWMHLPQYISKRIKSMV